MRPDRPRAWTMGTRGTLTDASTADAARLGGRRSSHGLGDTRRMLGHRPGVVGPSLRSDRPSFYGDGRWRRCLGERRSRGARTSEISSAKRLMLSSSARASRAGSSRFTARFLRRRAHLTGGRCCEHSSRFNGPVDLDWRRHDGHRDRARSATAFTQIDEAGGFRFRLVERFALRMKNTTAAVRFARRAESWH
jgi:hypothetical protein